MYKRSFIDYVVLYFKGLLMGTANKIPGVSGGMIALVLGFYEEMIYSFQKVNIKSLQLLFAGRFRKFFEYINFNFLFAINIGSVSAFFSVSLLIDWLMRTKEQGGAGFETEVWSYFFGLIIGSIYYIALKVQKWSIKPYMGVIFGAALGLWISFMNPMAPNDNYWFIFLCGIIGVSGMTLPGFSGSFILIIIGNYNLLLVDSVNNLFYTITAVMQGDFKMLGTDSLVERAERVRMLYIIAVFAIGSLFGMITFSKGMGFLLRKWHNIVIATLMGFVIGSLGAAWPWKTEDLDYNGQLLSYTRFTPDITDFSFIIQLVCIVVGILSILLIKHYENRRLKL